MLTATTLSLLAQEELAYQLPPQEIMQLADYERPPMMMMNSSRTIMILAYRPTYKTLEDLNIQDMRLGGLRIDPKTNISSTMNYLNNIEVQKVGEKTARQVQGLPANPRLGYMAWSKDEKFIACTHTTEEGVELWLINVEKATAKKLDCGYLNANMGMPFTWLNDSERLLVKLLPKNRKPLIDRSKELPVGPTVSTATGKESQNRTYQDLLKNKTDEANFEVLVKSELALVHTDGSSKKYLPEAMYASASISPDGRFILLTNIEKPFSYIVPFSRFPQRTKVYTVEGEFLAEVNFNDLAEIMPKGFMATMAGKRNMGWRSDKPASLQFVEALDGGDPAKEVTHRDVLKSWDAPFDKPPYEVAKTLQRFGGVLWGDENHAILYDQWYDTRNAKTYLINPSRPELEPKIIFDLNYQDAYNDPGSFATHRNEFNRNVLAIKDGKAYLIGEGYTPEGQFPFVDEFMISDFTTKRIYHSSSTTNKESIIAIEDFDKLIVSVQIESKTDYPNFYFRSLRSKAKPQQITFFKNPFESLNQVHKEVIKYKRKDGVELSGTLYLPPGYDMKKKEKLPLLIWAYPREYKDKSTAGQNTNNPNEFTYPYYGSFVYWAMRGYVVLDDASFPIVGEEKEEPNDFFIQQLVANAEAAIDAVDKLEYIDRSRVGVGGHSYGAFMTANLLTHSNLFACGIARSGAYNRTLTPFGFQSEQRNYWDVPEVYNTMSPFMNADKMKTPLLLVHGEADNNPGTFTLQTERYFQALKGLGAPVRMVILPKESHGYVARENIMHLLWEQDVFLEKHLKNK